jgi:tRNA(fMet)-specific endonuclease VapC
LYLLDTNIVSRIVRGKDVPTLARLKTHPPSDIGVSIVTRAEILFGLAKIGHPPRLSASVALFFDMAKTFALDEAAALAYADMRVLCEAWGLSLGPLDMMIAAQARALNATLVTNDSALKRLSHMLAVEDWTEV